MRWRWRTRAVVSAVSFATTVVIARTTTPDELGVYAIVTSLIASTIAVQESLVVLPYTIRRHRPVGSQAEYAGSVLGLSSVMAAVTAALLTVAALMLAAASADGEMTAVTWALAGLLPFALLREFGRRFAFARLQLGRALILDIAVAVLQIAGLGWLAWSGTMSAMSACGALTLAYGVTGLAWVYLARKEFAVSWNRLPATLRQSWELGRWLLAGKLTVQVQQYIIYWLSITMLGAATTGIYAACMSVVAFANPLVFGLGNILTPRSVLAWKNGGGSGLRRQAIRDSLTLLRPPVALLPGGAGGRRGHHPPALSRWRLRQPGPYGGGPEPRRDGHRHGHARLQCARQHGASARHRRGRRRGHGGERRPGVGADAGMGSRRCRLRGPVGQHRRRPGPLDRLSGAGAARRRPRPGHPARWRT